MKINKLAVSLLALGLLGSSAAFARESNKTTLNLYEKVTVNGTTLNPGKYTVDWEGTGADVKVNILQGKRTIATVPAHVTEQPTSNANSAYGSSTQPDGTRTLTTIFVGGQRTSLELNQASAGQSSNTSAAK